MSLLTISFRIAKARKNSLENAVVVELFDAINLFRMKDTIDTQDHVTALESILQSAKSMRLKDALRKFIARSTSSMDDALALWHKDTQIADSPVPSLPIKLIATGDKRGEMLSTVYPGRSRSNTMDAIRTPRISKTPTLASPVELAGLASPTRLDSPVSDPGLSRFRKVDFEDEMPTPTSKIDIDDLTREVSITLRNLIDALILEKSSPKKK